MGSAPNWKKGIIVWPLCCFANYASFSDNIVAEHRVTNQEYKFSVSFPIDAAVCLAESGDQPHGFFVHLDTARTDCQDVKRNTSASAISVYAYSNATFERKPEDETSSLCPRSAATAESSGEGILTDLAFPGHRSAACKVQRANGTIDVYVVAQAGQWAALQDSQELDAPYINYTASLHTTRGRFVHDIEVFRKILNSIEIDYPI